MVLFFSAQSLATDAVKDTESQLDFAIFAGGCFWCMEPPYDKLDGVVETVSGYAGGQVKNPTYKQVSAGNTGHREVIKIVYDPSIISYARLLDEFWKNVDPLDDGGQFCDRGYQYESAIYYRGEAQKTAAEASLKQLRESGKFSAKIATEILAATNFFPAEDYHQNYYQKNPRRYKYYRWRCGRDQRLETLWQEK
ncbi:MAG: peptide-methionine (S)-S-oxide reductase MsrA [bacterium]